jgi:hypothetical protein
MKKQVRFAFLLPCVFLLFACNGSKQSAKPNNTASMQELRAQSEENPKDRLPFNVCKAQCKLVSALPTSASADGKNPCVDGNCRATIVVEKILGCGRDFDGAVLTGRQIEVYASQPFVNLKPGEQFVCSLSAPQQLGAEKQNYFVSTVTKL